jgi:hypothetical protein
MSDAGKESMRKLEKRFYCAIRHDTLAPFESFSAHDVHEVRGAVKSSIFGIIEKALEDYQ